MLREVAATILPAPAFDPQRLPGETMLMHDYPQMAILFCDIVAFTSQV
jgi:hypothetical protein